MDISLWCSIPFPGDMLTSTMLDFNAYDLGWCNWSILNLNFICTYDLWSWYCSIHFHRCTYGIYDHILLCLIVLYMFMRSLSILLLYFHMHIQILIASLPILTSPTYTRCKVCFSKSVVTSLNWYAYTCL